MQDQRTEQRFVEAIPMSATGRAVLEYLGDRYKQAIEAKKIAEWTHRSLPKVQAALRDLREGGLVFHFPGESGHAGLWSVTPLGYQQIDASKTSPDRFRMALESILEIEADFQSSRTMQAIARRALKP